MSVTVAGDEQRVLAKLFETRDNLSDENILIECVTNRTDHIKRRLEVGCFEVRRPFLTEALHRQAEFCLCTYSPQDEMQPRDHRG